MTYNKWRYRRIFFLVPLLVAVVFVIHAVLNGSQYYEIMELPWSSPQKFLPSHAYDFADKAKLQDWNCSVSYILRRIENYEDLDKFDHCKRIFYNRVPKCGSRTLLNLFSNLSSSQHFKVYSDIKLSRLTPDIMVSFVKNFTQLDSPFIYSRHIHFVNFSRYMLPPPIYINVIRDPVKRLISHYHYNKYGSSNAPLATPRPEFNMSLEDCVKKRKGSCLGMFQTTLPYFCGLDKVCRWSSNPADRLAQAKRTVKESYLVVGITEDLTSFVEILESLLPNFFHNAGALFSATEKDLWNKTKTVKKSQVSPHTEAALKDFLALDYEFYEFVTQRFYTQLGKIRAIKRNEERRRQKLQMVEDEWKYIY